MTTRFQMQTAAETVRQETLKGANTNERVGSLLRNLADDAVGTPTELGQTAVAEETTPGSGIFFWQQKRGWITLNPTGAADVSATLNTIYATSRKGICVQLVDGVYGWENPVLMSRGSALVGRHKGVDFGHKQYNIAENIGTLLSVTGTGKMLLTDEQTTVDSLSIYYPNQETNATPDVYDYTFWASEGRHGVTITNITAINPYRLAFINVNGANLDMIQGQPISRGIDFGRCAEAVLASRCLFNSGGSFGVSGATLIAWMAANGVCYSIDGCEGYSFSECKAFGYKIGLDFEDLDNDNQTSYGKWSGGNIEGCINAVHVAANTGLSELKISDVNLVGQLTTGHLFSCEDVGQSADPPRILASNLSSWGPTGAILNMVSTSYVRFMQTNGSMGGYSGFGYRGSASTQVISLVNVATHTTSRISGGGAFVSDIGDHPL